MTDSANIVFLAPEEKKDDCVLLISGDEQRFSVPKSIVGLSQTIKQMLSDVGDMGDEELNAIPLPNVDGKTLEQVIEWLSYRTANPVPEIPFDPFYDTPGRKKPKYTPRIGGWDLEYCNRIKGNDKWVGIWPVFWPPTTWAASR